MVYHGEATYCRTRSNFISFLVSLIGNPKGNNARPVQPLTQRTIRYFRASAPANTISPAVVGIIAAGGILFCICILYGTISRNQDNQIFCCWKPTSYFSSRCLPIRKHTDSASSSINSLPESDKKENDTPQRRKIDEQLNSPTTEFVRMDNNV